MQTVNEILDEREARYGTFEGHSAIAQELKNTMYSTSNWAKLSYVQREALEMIQHKIARMLNGDPNYIDSPLDIVGYAQLMVTYMQGQAK